MEKSISPQVPTTQVPVMTIECFSELTDLTLDTIRGQLNQGNLPLIRVGRFHLVNVALCIVECLQSEDWLKV